MKNRFFIAFLLVALVMTSVSAAPNIKRPPVGGVSQNITLPELPTTGDPMTSARMKEVLSYLGTGHTATLIAEKLGVKELDGKKLDAGQRINGMDNIVQGNAYQQENEPSMAINPADENIVVVFAHDYGDWYFNTCTGRISYDGGETFTGYVYPPVTVGYTCSDPVVRFSPDGYYIYYEYMNVEPGGTFADTLVTVADGFAPWNIYYTTSPFPSYGAYFMDKNWLDVSLFEGANENFVYASTTYFDATGCGVIFNYSTDYGVTWAVPIGYIMEYDADCSTVYTGSRVIGTPNGRMLVCWYDSEWDGYLAGVFDIDCRENTNHGIDGFWSVIFTAVNDKKYETGSYLDPNGAYHRWRATMFPTMAVDPEGFIYIAFAFDPTDSNTDTQAGDVYVTYNNSPYSYGWVTPKAVGTGTYAQGYPTVSARYDPFTNKYVVYIAYSDYVSKNLFYHTVYKRGTRAPGSWTLSLGAAVKISDVPSLSDYLFIGDYIDSAVTSRRYHVVWTDRSDQRSIYDYDDDIVHDFVVP